MSLHPSTPRRARVATAIVLSSCLSALSLEACAESTEAGPDRADGSVVAPSPDVDAGTVPDGASDRDGALPDVPCAVGNVCRVPSPLVLGSIRTVSGRSRTDVWAAGSLGLTMHWEGKAWSALGSTLPEDRSTLMSLFPTPDEVWGVAGATIMRRGTAPESVRSFVLLDIARAPTSIAAVGGGGVYVGCSVGGLFSLPTATGALVEITDFDAGSVAVVPHPLLEATNQRQPMNIRALALAPGRALWAVGDQAAVARYPLEARDAGDDAGQAWALGEGIVLPLPVQQDLHIAWALGDHLWAAGDNGTLVHFDGTEWHEEASNTDAALHAVFGFSETDVWAAGDDGVLLHFDGKSWSHVPIQGYRGGLRTIWGAAPDDVWIGGEGGMFHWGPLP
ncbi:MAG: hypothetical protein BGO98_31020 [Myxococcales bacterium 68-20]|nr:MAG: hypothetical protein BGO98_31020 [Myxococcales bacterium 68-20]